MNVNIQINIDNVLHEAVSRALDEAGIKDEVLRGMCIEVAFEKAVDILNFRSRFIESDSEMLEALESFVHLYDDGAQFDESTLRKIANDMRAAFAKAKGESESPVTKDDKSESERSEA